VSSYQALSRVSATLRQILWSEFAREADVRDLIGNEDAITFRDPVAAQEDASRTLSLWAYQVVENDHEKNQRFVRPRDVTQQQYPPLAVNLFYLVTPFTATDEGDLLVLGKTMQVLYDNAVIRLDDPGRTVSEELHVILCRLTLEELTRIWYARQAPYRLSVCYEVRVVHIDSARQVSGAPVADRTLGLADMGARA